MITSIKAINDLKRLDEVLLSQIKEKMCSVVESGWYVLGNEVTSFEEKFASYCGVDFCVSVANGTEALELALKALNLDNGKNIITVANAGMYSTLAILAVGSQPVFIDVSSDTLTMDPQCLKSLFIQHKIDGIIVTHLYGQLADILSICKIAKEYNVPVIEDCAQAHGATLNGRRAGSFGDVGCFSFYPTKNLGAIGDGGAVVTNSQQLHNDLKKLRLYGWDKKYNVVKAGCRNSRLDEIQAGVLSLKLTHLDQWNQRRRDIVSKVSLLCKDVKSISFPIQFNSSYVGHLFIVRTTHRDKLRTFLESKNIPTDIHYPLPDYKQKTIQNAFPGIVLPVTEKTTSEILTLPCFPELTDKEVEYIANCLIEYDQCCL